MTSIADWGEIRYGLVLGRLQPLHLGHIEYLEAAKSRCDQLVVGVTNPNTNALLPDDADPKRSLGENNPFSYFDRQQMVSASLIELGWQYDDFSIVPAPINTPDEMVPYLPSPSLSTVFITVYDDWGERKADLIRSLGYQVEILWRRKMTDRLTSGTAIRNAIRSGAPWQHLVPRAVARYLDQSGWVAALADETKQAAEA
jgi:cytidyltransferase-like protein